MVIRSNIGRDLPKPSKFDISIPNDFGRVSHFHATIHWHGINNGKDGVVIIEDNDTPNGTFVNGRQYARVKLNENDIVRLGGNTKDDYQLDLSKIFDTFKKAELKDRTDFSEELIDLKSIYKDYQNKADKIKNNNKWWQRIVMYGVPTLTTSILGKLLTNNGLYSMFSAVPGLGIGWIIDRLFWKDDKEKMVDLKLKYQPHYHCPKCGFKFNIDTMHWKQLEAEGCPNPQCDAKFKKEEIKC